jgi:hypothetical protein
MVLSRRRTPGIGVLSCSSMVLQYLVRSGVECLGAFVTLVWGVGWGKRDKQASYLLNCVRILN